MRNASSLLWLALAIAVGCATDASPPNHGPSPAPVDVPEEVSVLRTTLIASAASPTSLTLRVENPGDAPARFSRYHTPFEGVLNDFVTVQAADGTEVAYQGPMVKRGPPGPEDDVVVAPGAAAEATFDLVPAWPVTSGPYTVRFTGGSVSGLPASEPVAVSVP